MEELFFVITLFLIATITHFCIKPNKSRNSKIKQFGNSNSQISIQSGSSSCSTSNNNGHIEINGTVKSLKVNGKKLI